MSEGTTNVAWLEFAAPNLGALSHVLREETIVGRAAEANVRLDSARVARRHLRLSPRPSGRWEATDLGSPGGTYVNRKRLSPGQLLENGDVFDTLDFVFRQARVPALVENDALDAQVDDPAAWEVWADALLERGVPLGQWLRSPPDDPVSRAAFCGALLTPHDPRGQLRWNRWGFAETLVLDDVLLQQRPWFGDLLRAPALRYLTRLELEVRELHLPECFEVLAAIPLPRALRHIEGVSPPAPLFARWQSLKRELRQRCPHLD